MPEKMVNRNLLYPLVAYGRRIGSVVKNPFMSKHLHVKIEVPLLTKLHYCHRSYKF